MSRLNLPFFLARHIARGGHRGVMVRIATLSVAISVAVMVIALGVIYGFKHEITEKLSGFGAHVQIVHIDGDASHQSEPIHRDQPFTEALRELPHFAGMAPYAIKIGIPRSEHAVQGIMLKGVDSTYDWSFIKGYLQEGRLPRVTGTRHKEILISRSLADRMEVGVGDRLEIIFIEETPRRDRFRISGIYDTHYGEMDRMMALTDLREVQRLNGWDSSQVSGIELRTSDFNKIEEFTDTVYQTVLHNMSSRPAEPLRVVNLKERFPMVFDWLKAHNVNAAVIISIMLTVSLINMIAAMLIILLERTPMIGMLKTMGMSNRALQRTFLIHSSFILLRGMVWGNIIGVALCLVQHLTGWVTLNEEGYFLSSVPIALDWQWIAALNGATFVVLVTLLSLPTMIISLILPEKTIRFE